MKKVIKIKKKKKYMRIKYLKNSFEQQKKDNNVKYEEEELEELEEENNILPINKVTSIDIKSNSIPTHYYSTTNPKFYSISNNSNSNSNSNKTFTKKSAIQSQMILSQSHFYLTHLLNVQIIQVILILVII